MVINFNRLVVTTFFKKMKLGIKRYIQNFLSLFRCPKKDKQENGVEITKTKITEEFEDDTFVYVNKES
jgi:hypothetical protein